MNGRDRIASIETGRANNVGVLRLLFASLVIVGHAAEMTTGDRSREPLTRLFGTVSLGELSVDAFFLLSGYLITKSMVRTGALLPYLERRVLRIYPAFLLASILCVYALAPLVGGVPPAPLRGLAHMLALGTDTELPGLFPGMRHYPTLNGSMWTIAYEFRCYLLVALLWSAGLLRRGVVLALTGLLLAGAIATTYRPVLPMLAEIDGVPHLAHVLGHAVPAIVLSAAFLVGACFYLYRASISALLTGRAAIVCAAAAIASLYRDPHFAEAALVTFGAVPLFWLSFRADFGRVQRINDRWDISYGVYLYGWPIANTIRWLQPSIGAWALAGMTLPIAFAFGAASWWGLERWVKDIRRSRDHPMGPAATAVGTGG